MWHREPKSMLGARGDPVCASVWPIGCACARAHTSARAALSVKDATRKVCAQCMLVCAASAPEGPPVAAHELTGLCLR